MRLPLKRILHEHRRVTIPVVAGLVLNIALYAGVVFPLTARARSEQVQAQTAEQQLLAAHGPYLQFFNGAQQCGLHRQGQFGHLVKEQRAALCVIEQPVACVRLPLAALARMAKQFHRHVVG